MNMVLKEKIMLEIDAFLDKEIVERFENKKTGKIKKVTYKTFNSSNALVDKQYLKKLLYNIYNEMLKFGNEKLMTKNFIETLNQINAIRIDLTDDNLRNTTLFEDFKEMKNTVARGTAKRISDLQKQIKNKNKIIKSSNASKEEKQLARLEIQNIQKLIKDIKTDTSIKNGVSTPNNNLILPELSEELRTNNPNKDGSHTFIHEFIHSLTRKNGHIGIWYNSPKRGIWDDLNEGFTEHFAQIFITDFKFPNSNRRYVLRSDLVKDIINIFPKGEIEELYLSGQCEKIIKMFKSTYNENNKSLFEYLNEIQQDAVLYAKQNNITNRNSVIAASNDKLSELVKNKISKDLLTFRYCQNVADY